MTKAPTATEMSKGQSDNTNNATKKFDYTAVVDRLRTVSWNNYSHPTGVVNLVYGPNLPAPRNSRVIKRYIIMVLLWFVFMQSSEYSNRVYLHWYIYKKCRLCVSVSSNTPLTTVNLIHVLPQASFDKRLKVQIWLETYLVF